eukprot:CAMPEP_0195115690 /NCGR_PEP_ID=MMETSP0448-20130528/109793_1 /TAXON_ID=66468 /ORGANISM="Heterocapsa triquestra, Strain CCMP 448" /LENGTH=46 /DNA_ID= /DNA_START= /DNA_END= /DNA_ORIENTATION=
MAASFLAPLEPTPSALASWFSAYCELPLAREGCGAASTPRSSPNAA